MKIKVEFVGANENERGTLEVTFDEVNNNVLFQEPFFFEGADYVWLYGTTKIWKHKDNVICAEEVELKNININVSF